MKKLIKKQKGGEKNDLIKNFDRYMFKNVLGKGGFGVTYLVYDNLEKKDQVAKVAKINSKNEKSYIKELDNLITIYKNTCRSDLICIRNYYTEILNEKSKKLVIILDKVDGIELREFIELIRSGKIVLKIEDYLFIFKNLLNTLNYLHNKLNMAHMDIKPENIMINPTTFTTTIIDVGLSCTEVFCKPGGTYYYMTKNILKNFENNTEFSKDTAKRGDVYSMGVVFLELLDLINFDSIIISNKSDKNFVDKGYYYYNIIQYATETIETEIKKYKDNKNQSLTDLIKLSIIMVRKNLLIDSIIKIYNTIENYIVLYNDMKKIQVETESNQVASETRSLKDFFNREPKKQIQ